ncbi:MAG: tyrosine-type recombinase/integrase [Nitrososphaera sp.]
MSQILQNFDCMSVFEEYITNKHTRKLYLGSFDRFMRYFKITDPSYFLKLTNEEIYDILKRYLLHLRQRTEKGTLKVNTIRIELAGIVHFFTYNDRVVNWKKLYKTIPQNVKNGGEKAYTKDQIGALLAATTKTRNKLLVLFMASTGARVGSLPELKLKHVKQIENCYYVVLYNEEKEEYVSFMTPECSRLYEQYLQIRKSEGEVLTQESYLFRHDYAYGRKTNQPIVQDAVYHIISRMVKKSGIGRIKKGRRYDIPIDHGFRKFFATQIKSNPQLSHSVTERLLGHQEYLESSYFLPEIEKLFKEYKKAIPDLTINDIEAKNAEIKQLQAQINERIMLEDKIERQNQIIRAMAKKLGMEIS